MDDFPNFRGNAGSQYSAPYAEAPAMAVLIDAENVSPRYADMIFAEIALRGFRATCRRAYANWASSLTSGWRDAVAAHAIEPVQQFPATPGKGVADPCLIIDAMDLLHEGRVDGLCIVSSDGDFTRLALRARRSGLLVLGMGEEKAPQAYRAACDEFVVLWLDPEATADASRNDDSASTAETSHTVKATPADKEPMDKATSENKSDKKDTGKKKGNKAPSKKDVKKAVLAIIAENPSGEVTLSTLGNRLPQSCPGFDAANFGYVRLNQFLKDRKYVKVSIRDNQYVVQAA